MEGRRRLGKKLGYDSSKTIKMSKRDLVTVPVRDSTVG